MSEKNESWKSIVEELKVHKDYLMDEVKQAGAVPTDLPILNQIPLSETGTPKQSDFVRLNLVIKDM